MRSRRLFVVTLALLLAIVFSCSPPRRPEEPSGPHFKVMSWNVNFGGPRPDLVPVTILEEDPDIVCLQETTPAWERFLRPRLRDRYPHIRFHHSRGAGGQAFFSRFPLEEQSLDASPVGWFPAWTMTAKTPLGPVQIQNLHLHPAVNERGSFTPAAYLSTAPEARLKEVKALEKALDPKKPALIVGDLNESSSYAVERLEARGFTDALPEFAYGAKTWRWRLSCGLTIYSRLDHIMYGSDLHCTEARVLEKGASDHFPVVAVFQRPPAGSPRQGR